MMSAIEALSDLTVPAETSAQGRMRLCRRLAEIGVRMAERLDRQSELAGLYAESQAVPEHLQAPYARRMDEIARSFAQVSRAASIAIALEDRIERGPSVPAPDVTAATVDPKSRLSVRRAEVFGAVRDAIDRAPPARIPQLCADLDRLIDRELSAVDAFLDHPVEEVIARAQRDLGLAATPSGQDAHDDAEDDDAPAPDAAAPLRQRRRLADYGEVIGPGGLRRFAESAQSAQGPTTVTRAKASGPWGGGP